MDIQEPHDDTLIGKTIGKYLIEEEAGRGGMSTVYKARDKAISRTVAMKILPPHFLHVSGFFERFKREVSVISSLEHPHILPIYDYGSSQEGIPYIVMRYMSGGTLEQLIGTPDLQALETPLRQVAQALDYAHRNNIIHRDLKPSNVMLDEEQNAYLSDFGTAYVENSQLTGSGIIGTPHYMSPEQIDGTNVTHITDIYSLGVVIYELISGQHPYEDETVAKILYRTIHEGLPPLSDFRDDTSPELQEVISKATHKDPNERYQTAGELVQAFAKARLAPPRKSSTGRKTVVDNNKKEKGTSKFEKGQALHLNIKGYDKPIRIRFTKYETITFGREPELAKIDLDPYGAFDQGVSRVHAALNFNSQEQCLEVWDLGSSNGTFLNDEKLEQREPHKLHDGDEIRLSMLVISLEYQDD